MEMRMKRARGPGDGGEGPPSPGQPERPMSWEAHEDDHMEVQPTNEGVSTYLPNPISSTVVLNPLET